MNQQNLNTAQFAKICNTQKSTLLFYDKEGLLKPQSISENGYRSYNIEQYFDYELIRILKDTGASLKEIKTYIHNMDGSEFLDFLGLRLQKVKQDLKELADKKNMLEDMIAILKEALNTSFDKIYIEQSECELYEIFKCDDGSNSDDNFITYSQIKHFQKERARTPFGVIVDVTEAQNGNYKEIAMFNKKRKCTVKENIHIKEAGTYACIAHHGTKESHDKFVPEFLKQIQQLGMTVKGNLYISDFMRLVQVGDEINYSQKYTIRVM